MANAVGPLAAVVEIFRSGSVQMKVAVPTWVLVLGGAGIVCGLATYGYRVMTTVGTKITLITPSRGLAADIAGMTMVLICSRLKLPVYVTENGIPDEDDDQRPRHLLDHLHQMWHAIQLCCPVMGYYHWTLVDNFEWARGWTLRFGLISLDPKTQKRKPRRSAQLYADIVREQAITPQMIDEYAPELRSKLLP